MSAPSTSSLSVITVTSYRRKPYLFLPFIMAYAGRLYSNGLQVHERVKILLLEVYERGLKGLPGLVIWSFLKDIFAFIAVKRHVAFLTRYAKGV